MISRFHGGRCLLVGFKETELGAGLAARLRALEPAGVILFRRNLATPQQTIALLDGVRELLPRPALLALDQEGGRVSRLEPWIGPTPSAERLAGVGPDATGRFARATGRALRALGFNLDFAPVVDLSAPDAPNGIGSRSFATDPSRVVANARAFLVALESEGVAGCLKHFPGLGDTKVDSHHELPRVERSRAELEPHLEPYRELGTLAPVVMVGHGSYPALDPEPSRPASCSAAIVSGLLRGELGYAGLVATDDLEMGAVAPRDADGSVAVEALAAGADLLLYCADLDRAEEARRAIDRAVAGSPTLAARLAEAVESVERFRQRWAARREPVGWEQACAEFAPFRSLA